jgi:hypothetical protein
MPNDDEEDNVIEFRSGNPDLTGRTINWGRRCKHTSIHVDEETRTVSCTQCEETINVFDWLSDWARNETIDFSRTDQAKRMLDEINEEIRDAKKELRSLEAKIKRRKKKIQP